MSDRDRKNPGDRRRALGALGDDELRRAFRQMEPRGTTSAASSDNVTPDELWALAEDRLPAERARAVVDQMSRSPALAEEFRLTLAMFQEAAGTADVSRDKAPGEAQKGSLVSFPASSATPPKPQRPRRVTAWLALAASMLVAAGVALLVQRPPPSDPPYRRLPAGEPRIESRLHSDTWRHGSALELEWTEIAGARYDVVVTTESLDILREELGLATPSLRVEPAEIDAMADGDAVLWHVEAILADGRRVSSPVFRVVVRRSE
ncbi:MAG: hypothetical protein AAGM22_30560 [Acidobacteriota bacterium]